MRILYIAGLGRSGSTLLARMLGQLDDVLSVGELHHLWQTGAPARSSEELCGCGATFRDCPLWNRALDEAFPEGCDAAALAALKASVDRIRYVPWMVAGRRPRGYARRLAEYRRVVAALYHGLECAGEGRVVVDATKDVSPLYLLSTLPEFQVVVVHLVRDPRGVAHSWGKRLRRPEFVGREVYMNRHGAADTAVRWLYTNVLAERAARRHAGYLRLRYEDLITDPRPWLERIVEAAGLRRTGLGFLRGGRADLARDSHTLSGNPVRFHSGPVELRLDDDWRRAMPRARRLAVTALTSPLLGRYGYPVVTGR